MIGKRSTVHSIRLEWKPILHKIGCLRLDGWWWCWCVRFERHMQFMFGQWIPGRSTWPKVSDSKPVLKGRYFSIVSGIPFFYNPVRWHGQASVAGTATATADVDTTTTEQREITSGMSHPSAFGRLCCCVRTEYVPHLVLR